MKAVTASVGYVHFASSCWRFGFGLFGHGINIFSHDEIVCPALPKDTPVKRQHI